MSEGVLTYFEQNVMKDVDRMIDEERRRDLMPLSVIYLPVEMYEGIKRAAIKLLFEMPMSDLSMDEVKYRGVRIAGYEVVKKGQDKKGRGADLDRMNTEGWRMIWREW